LLINLNPVLFFLYCFFQIYKMKVHVKAFIFSRDTLWGNSICLLRIWCGIIFIKYGVSIFHSASVEDFAHTLSTVNISFPLLSAYLCKSTEFFGGICFVAGFLIKPFSVFLVIDMVVASFIFHHGHLLNNGLTTFLLLICLLQIFLSKADMFTVDNYINNKSK
jgi:uncharacterized membrane protein YphA (DoxX/SURF4 family)